VDPMPKNNDLTTEEKARILGGEATMWSELATPLNIDSRLWPRTAAIAERFWSNESVTDVESMYKRLDYVSFRLEELGVNHIRNRNVILRNITNNQNTKSLEFLASVCEPIKIYTRNAGGIEYKTYSPFTLFADACTVDASDSFKFRKVVNGFLENQNGKTEMLSFFDAWIYNYENFKTLNKNPILNEIDPLYSNLASISRVYKKALVNDTMSIEELKKMNALLLKFEDAVVDVELAVYNDFKKLSAFLISKYGNQIQSNGKVLKQ